MGKHIQINLTSRGRITAKGLVKIGEYITKGISDGINVIHDIPALRDKIYSYYGK